MSERSSVTLKRSQLAGAAVVFVALGALGAYVVLRQSAPASPGSAPQTMATAPAAAGTSAGAPVPAGDDATASPSSWPDVTITLTPEAAQRANIEIASVLGTTASGAAALRIPAVVQANAYHTVKVTPVVGGRITRATAEVGQEVRAGQTLAEIYSPDMSDAQTRYLSARAALDAHERMLQRTEKLVDIGSASRQELEQVHAEHTAATTAVDSARARLRLLGMTDEEIGALSASSSATVRITAPLGGVVTERMANVGTNVDASTPLFTVVDLSTVWVVGSVYEADFGRVRVGTPVSVALRAFPNAAMKAAVTYVDPQVNPETRAAQVRVEVPNRDKRLKLNMYAELTLSTSGAATPALLVPKSAVQIVSDRSVVYLAASEAGKFIEREVQLGESVGDMARVRSGLQAGDRIVTRGSFALRAERERAGLRPPPSAAAASESPAAAPTQSGEVRANGNVRIVVSEQGFTPSSVKIPANTPVRITFVRTTDKTCATEIVVPSLNIKRTLPLNQPVDVEIPAQKSGQLAFACGMAMFKGTVIVE